MATKKTKKWFTVGAKCTIDTDIQVEAESLEEALAFARDFTVLDFVEPKGNHNDSNFVINNVFSNND